MSVNRRNVEAALQLTQSFHASTRRRTDLPRTTPKVLLAMIARGSGLALSAFGMLAAPAEARAILARVRDAVLNGG